MLTVLRNDDGQIDAVCEWWPVDFNGRWEPYGEFIWVEQLDLTPGQSGRQVIPQVIADIAHRVPWARAAYWERRDKTRQRPRTYTRAQLVKGGMVACGPVA